jgi:chromosome partitioning protein
MAVFFSFWSGQGGGGKTTIAHNLGTALSRLGNDVLIVDFDPQNSSLTREIGVDEELTRSAKYNPLPALIPNFGKKFMGEEQTLDSLIIPQDDVRGMEFDLIPSHVLISDLSKYAYGDYDGQMPERMLFRAFARSDINDTYDYVLVDVAGSSNMSVATGVIGARNVFVPVPLSGKGTDSLAGVAGDLNKWNNQLSNNEEKTPKLSIVGIIPNKVETTKRKKHDWAREKFEKSGHPRISFEFSDLNIYDASWSYNMSIFQYAESKYTQALRDYEERVFGKFEALAREIENGGIDGSQSPIPFEDVSILDHDAVQGPNGLASSPSEYKKMVNADE